MVEIDYSSARTSGGRSVPRKAVATPGARWRYKLRDYHPLWSWTYSHFAGRDYLVFVSRLMLVTYSNFGKCLYYYSVISKFIFYTLVLTH